VYQINSVKLLLSTGYVFLTAAGLAFGAHLKAPPGMFKDLNDEIVGDAIIIKGKQLFIDDYIIGELKRAEKILNQPVKHPKNPLIIPDKPWEGKMGTTATIYDKEERLYKLWYTIFLGEYIEGNWPTYGVAYATSPDGINWRKPAIRPWKGNQKSNIVFPGKPALNCAGVFKDAAEIDPTRRYKMICTYCPDGTAKTASTNVAYSPDGIHWTDEPENPAIPFCDWVGTPFRYPHRAMYVVYPRYGPPNRRLVTRIESEDFVHWSPKVTVFRRTKMDVPFVTKHHGMAAGPYEGVYIGLLQTYHGETIKPIPKDKLWMDKMNTQLAFSRNSITWLRVGKHGAIPTGELNDDRDWKTVAEQATFIPYGQHGKDWDWGAIEAWEAPLVVDDEIRIYYVGFRGRFWAWARNPYHKDKIEKKGYSLATLRLDGFVSINAEKEGAMTTKPFVFIGDTLEVNANAASGSIRVEALDPVGKVIEGFAKKDCTAITSDSVRHVLKWKDKGDCHLIQARPIKLRFYLKKAKLYSFTPRIRHKHYIQSYD